MYLPLNLITKSYSGYCVKSRIILLPSQFDAADGEWDPHRNVPEYLQ